MNGIGKFNILRILQNRRNDQCSAPSQALGKEQSDWENENKELRDYIFIQKQRLQVITLKDSQTLIIANKYNL